MKKLIIALLLLAAVLCGAIALFSACGAEPAQDAAQQPVQPAASDVPALQSEPPAPTPTPVPKAPEPKTLELPAEGEPLEFDADLDLDGKEEHIALREKSTEEEPLFLLEITDGSGEGEPAAAILPVLYLSQAILADLDGGDGLVELIVSGDLMSADYTTYCFRYDGTLLQSEVSGTAIAVEDGALRVSDYVDLLGTRTAEMLYVLDENYEFQPARELWVYGEPDFSDEAAEYGACLTVKKKLPVTLPDGTASTLPKKTKLCLVDTDGKTTVTYCTEDGARGSIAVTEGEYGFEIDGVSEYEYFKLVPYSG